MLIIGYIIIKFFEGKTIIHIIIFNNKKMFNYYFFESIKKFII